MEITDIKIPFWRLVLIFVKWAIAAIPAAIILTLIFGLVIGAIVAVVGVPVELLRRF
jgi:predicted ABC-type sugar transport system permease subunit